MLELLIHRSAYSVGGNSCLAGMVTPYLAYSQGTDICWLVLGLDTAVWLNMAWLCSGPSLHSHKWISVLGT